MMWLVYAILAAMIWGLNYALDERVFKYAISPFTLLALIGVSGGIIFSLAAYFSHLKTDMAIMAHNKAALWIMVSTVIAANLGALFITLSIQAKNATLAAIIELSYPLFTILFTLVLFKENYLNVKVVLGGILMIAGATIIGIAA